MLVRLVQPANAEPPILVTESGISMLFSPVQKENASSPILVTVYPPRVEGMVTSPPSPVYLVISAVPS